MYSRQRGILPILVFTLGLALLVFAALISIKFGSENILNTMGQRTLSISDLLFEILFNVIAAMFLLFPFWFFGSFLLLTFPEIKILPIGLKYKSIIFSGLIKWSEIGSLVALPYDLIGVVINRRGFYFLNGLYFNKFYALIFRYQDPILLFAPGLENREYIISEIRKNILLVSSQEHEKTKL